MKKLSIEGIVDMLLSYCPRKYSDRERLLIVTGYEWELQDVPPDKLEAGWKKAISAHDGFMMPPGKFKEMCLSGAGSHSLEEEAGVAWSLVMKNLNSYASPVFKDSAIAEAIRNMGGWKHLCSMLTTEEPFRRRDFIGVYMIMRRQKIEFDPALKGGDKFFINGKFQSNYIFIGYADGDDTSEVLKMIEQKEESDKKFLAMVRVGADGFCKQIGAKTFKGNPWGASQEVK